MSGLKSDERNILLMLDKYIYIYIYIKGKYLLPVGSKSMLYTNGHKPIIYHNDTNTSFILKPSSPFRFRSFFRKYKSLD